MKKLAKLTSLLLAGIMALAMLTACNGSAAEAEALGKQYTEQALAILNEYRATQNTEQTPYPQLANDPDLLALAKQQLKLIGQDGKIAAGDTWYTNVEGNVILDARVMIEPVGPGEMVDMGERCPALALTAQRLAELNTTKVFGANLPLASQKTLDMRIIKVAFAYRVVGGKAYVAMAFARPIK